MRKVILMGEITQARLTAALSKHYRSQLHTVAPEEIDRIASLMVIEDARARKADARTTDGVSFVAAQVRYIPAWTWAAQALVVALMIVMAYTSGSAMATKTVIGILSAVSVLVGVPTVHASKRHAMAELEYSCTNNTASVMLARLIALGCSSALAVVLMVFVTAAHLDLGAFSVTLWAAPPFFCSCAGSLLVLRKAAPSSATVLCVAWTVVCSAALMSLSNVFPEMYGDASLTVWAGASVAALIWLVREIVMTLRSAAAGLDVFAPQIAKTYN